MSNSSPSEKEKNSSSPRHKALTFLKKKDNGDKDRKLEERDDVLRYMRHLGRECENEDIGLFIDKVIDDIENGTHISSEYKAHASSSDIEKKRIVKKSKKKGKMEEREKVLAFLRYKQRKDYDIHEKTVDILKVGIEDENHYNPAYQL